MPALVKFFSLPLHAHNQVDLPLQTQEESRNTVIFVMLVVFLRYLCTRN